MRNLPLCPSNSSVYSGKPELASVVSSTNAGGRFLLDPAFDASTIRSLSLLPSRCRAAAVRLTPSLPATAAAAAHNSSGMGVFPCRLCLHCSNRVLTSSTLGAREFVLRDMPILPSGPTAGRTNLSVTRNPIHASLQKPHTGNKGARRSDDHVVQNV